MTPQARDDAVATDDGTVKWVRIAAVADLPPGAAREVCQEGRVYAVFRLGDEVFALDGLCPHQGGHLAETGRAAEIVTCLRVGCLRWGYDPRTGACVQHPRVRVRTFPVRVERDAVFMALPR